MIRQMWSFFSASHAEMWRSVEICCLVWLKSRATVDGWNPAPPRMMIIPLFTGFHTSQVVQDFFHQQYHPQKFDKFRLVKRTVEGQSLVETGSQPLSLGRFCWSFLFLILQGMGFHKTENGGSVIPVAKITEIVCMVLMMMIIIIYYYYYYYYYYHYYYYYYYIVLLFWFLRINSISIPKNDDLGRNLLLTAAVSENPFMKFQDCYFECHPKISMSPEKESF